MSSVVRICGRWVCLVCCFPVKIMEKRFVEALFDLTTITRLWCKLWWEKRGKGYGIWRLLPHLGCWSQPAWAISSAWRSGRPVVVFRGILGLSAGTCQVKLLLCQILSTTWKLWGILEARSHERLIFPIISACSWLIFPFEEHDCSDDSRLLSVGIPARNHNHTAPGAACLLQKTSRTQIGIH